MSTLIKKLVYENRNTFELINIVIVSFLIDLRTINFNEKIVIIEH